MRSFALSCVFAAAVTSAAGLSVARAASWARFGATACRPSNSGAHGASATAVYIGGVSNTFYGTGDGEWLNYDTGQDAQVDCPIPNSDAYELPTRGASR
jgi:hypothetical protein